VVVINRPLEGGVAAPAGTEEMTRKDVNVFIAMLRSFPENQVRLLRFIAVHCSLDLIMDSCVLSLL
jgi:hypothetical protein